MIKRRKTSSSLTISQKLLSKMVALIKSGKFSSVSDIVNVSVSMFLGKLSVYEMDQGFNYSAFIASYQEDDSPREKISVSYSEYLNEELERLSSMTQKNKSFLVRVALDSFFDFHTNKTNRFEKLISKKMENIDISSLSREDLKSFISEILKEIKDSEN